MKYSRLYTDSDGETHFEDVDVEFGEGQLRSGGPKSGLSAPQQTSGAFFLEPYTEFFTDYHPTPRRQWFIVLSGIGELGASDGEVRRFGPGDLILLDDMESKGHTSRVIEVGNFMLVGLED